MSGLQSDGPRQNLAGWPPEVLAIVERAITCEYATLTQRNTPITYPVTPYLGEHGRTLDVSTGLAYPAKAERARRNPKVALLFSDAIGSGLTKPPVVLVHGLATVRDADLQGNTDRYLRVSMAKVAAAYAGIPPFMMQRLQWYLARIWIEVTPVRMLWWPEGQLAAAPEQWEAAAGTIAPPSDPAPTGKALGIWKEGSPDWRSAATFAVQRLGEPILTVVTADGFPLPMRVQTAMLSTDGIRIEVPAGMPPDIAGPACLTFHTHPDRFTGQQNMVFVGQVRQTITGTVFVVERQLGDWSLAGSKLQTMWSFMKNRRTLGPRVVREAQRRGQPVPTIRLPDRA